MSDALNDSADDMSPDQLGLEISKAVIKRLSELTMEALEKDLAIAVAGNSPLKSIIPRAKWKKKTDLMFEANRLFERRYGSPKGELQLVQELFGDQLNRAIDRSVERFSLEKRRAFFAWRRGAQVAPFGFRGWNPRR
jgi:hypothetical protein